jgi:hypothetical protein
VYGTLGTPAAGNVPGSRNSAMGWTDSGGHLWLSGGYGYDSVGNTGYLNDLWEFNPSTNEWAWMDGSNTVDCTLCYWPGAYGTFGIPSAANLPGSRFLATSWTDLSGYLWLFGGHGADATDIHGDLNDVWEYQPPASAAPAITSASGTTFISGTAGTFTVIATGYPVPTLSETGALPSGVTFTNNGNGTATLAGTPTVAGTFPITVTASNGVSPNAKQSFTLVVNPVASVLTSPTSGSTLTGSSVTFSWTSETGATQYYLSVGSTGVGSTNVYNSGWRTVTTWAADPLPTNGETLYVRLSTDYSGTVVHNDYTYTAYTPPAAATITSPTAGSILTGISVPFTWTSETGATQYYLSVGSTGVGSTNVYNSGWRTVTTWAADPLPTNGETLYVRLSTDYSGTVVHNDYIYTAATETAAAITSPVSGATLTGPSVAFTWSAATGATQYYLSVGSTGVGSTNVYDSGWRTVTTWAADPLPTNGETLYVRLSTDYSGTVVYNDYIYTASTQSAVTSPTAGSVLTGPSVPFNWSAATGATQYSISVGSTGVGSTNVYNSGWRDALSWTATGLPTNGETLYVTLSTDYNGLVVKSNTTYLAATAAVLSTPAPFSTLSGSSVTFDWTAGTTGATQYYLSIGSTGVGSSNIYNSGWRDVTSWTATGLPTNGETLYVRLSTNFGGTAVHNDYTYTAY